MSPLQLLRQLVVGAWVQGLGDDAGMTACLLLALFVGGIFFPELGLEHLQLLTLDHAGSHPHPTLPFLSLFGPG